MTFAELALICAVGLFGPLLSLPRRIGLPVVVGELLIGVAVGRTGAAWLNPSAPTFAFLAQIGFALVMFVAGTHVPLRSAALRSGWRVGAARAVLVAAVALPVAWSIARLFDTGHTALYAVLLASSSASLVMPALDGVPADGPVMARLLAQLAIADTACIVALPLALDPTHAARAALGAVVVWAAAALMYAALRWAAAEGRIGRVRRLSQARRLALELRISLTALFGLAAIAVAFHVSVMLAGFAAGLVVAAMGEPRRLATQLFALTEGFFGPIFFVWLGSSLDLRALARHPQAVGLGVVLGLAALLVHALPALLRQPWPAATMTAGQLGVPVAAAALGSASGVLISGEATALLLGALITVAATALLVPRVRRLAENGSTEPPPTLAARH
ncbi:cation:proton antiporter [Calidifontibacter terrae]